MEEICSIVKTKGGYYYVNYCFLEVLPPFIEEGIKKCQENGVDAITVMPYFLYPGMKLKDSVRQSARICKIQRLNLVIAKPLSYHAFLYGPAILVTHIHNMHLDIINNSYVCLVT
ncbi:MAG: CbiX/SirB N-terminal domain-containing protein [Candidatus Nitrosopolaris sp.]